MCFHVYILLLYSHTSPILSYEYFSHDPYDHHTAVFISYTPSDADSYKAHRPDIDLTIVEGDDHPTTVPLSIPPIITLLLILLLA